MAKLIKRRKKGSEKVRTLLLFRGAPGCGKSTFIEKNGLKPYTISSDDLRLLYSSYSFDSAGNLGIDGTSEKQVWETLYSILEYRMSRGEFTVIDACNSKTSEMNKYKALASKYRYRMFCVDMTDIPIEVVKERNNGRAKEKRVPESAIDKMVSRFKTQSVPSRIKSISPSQIEEIFIKPLDFSKYKKIHHIGDIHGCYTVLKDYIDSNGGFKEDEFYIFLGDYIDRGIENADVIKFLLEIMNFENVLLIEGNHERHIYSYAHGEESKSKIFELTTRPQLLKSGISLRDIRVLYNKFAQCAYYTYLDKTFLVTHGGVSNIPTNLLFLKTKDMINGIGYYKDAGVVSESFVKNLGEDYIQIHGHRNIEKLPINSCKNSYNLEDSVEFGGNLRCVVVSNSNGKCNFDCVSVKNTVFDQHNEKPQVVDCELKDVIINLRNNPYVKEKVYENISSFNFTKQAFKKNVWSEQTIKARGLFINNTTGKIAARSYEKFFNINQNKSVGLNALKRNMVFPINAYVKENGFLGIIGYNSDNDELIITSKSAIDGDFSQYFKNLFIKIYGQSVLDSMKYYIKKENKSFVFECIDMENDPHIIKYAQSDIILLDVIDNDIDFKKLPYDKLCDISEFFGLHVKELAYKIDSWQDFFAWYLEVINNEYMYNGRHIEGFVIEDSVGFMVKIKLDYYNFWKMMRGITHEVLRCGYTTRTSALITPLSNMYYGWLKEEYQKGIEYSPNNICLLRDKFEEYQKGV